MENLTPEKHQPKSSLLRQRLGIFREAAKISYDIGALCRIALARKGHFRAWSVSHGIGQKKVQIGVGPGLALGFYGFRIFKADDGTSGAPTGGPTLTLRPAQNYGGFRTP